MRFDSSELTGSTFYSLDLHGMLLTFTCGRDKVKLNTPKLICFFMVYEYGVLYELNMFFIYPVTSYNFTQN